MSVDFRRIQIILIITFSILNIYLLTVFLEKNDELNFGDPSATVNLEEGLRNDNIDSPDLSRETEQIAVIKTDKTSFLRENAATLKNQTTRVENNVLFSVLSEPIALNLDDESLTLTKKLEPLQTFIDSGNVLNGHKFAFLSYHPISKRIVYAQYTDEGIPIADDTASLIFHLSSENEVITYEQKYAGDSEAQGRKRKAISQQAAIESLYLNNQIPNNSTIKLMTLGYYQTLSLKDMNIYTPMWYVEIASETRSIQIKRVDALTGNIISAPVIQEDDEGNSESESSSEPEARVTDIQTNMESEDKTTERKLISE